jgi:hypothetical protein
MLAVQAYLMPEKKEKMIIQYLINDRGCTSNFVP